MHVYNWITLLYLWTWHNIGNQLYFNIKKLKGWGGLFLKNYITFLKLWNYVVSIQIPQYLVFFKKRFFKSEFM